MEPASTKVNERAQPVDSLLHVADLHFWRVIANPFRLLNKRFLGNLNVWLRRRHEFPMEKALVHIDALAATGLRQLLLTGDFSSTSLDEEFAPAREFVDALRDRGFALYVMPGNHDVYTFETVRKQRFERHFGPYLPAEGFPAVRHLPGGTPLVLVPTVCPNLVSSKGRITPAQIEEVAAFLRDAPQVMIVAGHYPLLDATAAYHLTRERRLRNAQALREALGASGRTILYVAGHVHRFSYVRDPEFPSLSHLCTGAFFIRNRREGITGEFARIDVLSDGFRIQRHTLRDTWTSNTISPGQA